MTSPRDPTRDPPDALQELADGRQDDRNLPDARASLSDARPGTGWTSSARTTGRRRRHSPRWTKEGQRALHIALVEFLRGQNTYGGDALVVPAEYLEVVITK